MFNKLGLSIAILTNSIDDGEYIEHNEPGDGGLIRINGIAKRFFSVQSLSPFLTDFKVVIFDNEGQTKKDSLVGTGNLIRFIGTNKK